MLKDCYIGWSRERVERWVKGYRRVLGNLGANVGDSEYQFIRWFDLIGVQRHIKVLGIFCRLWHRDGKIGYLADLPLTFDYVLDACRRYPELVEFGRWLEWRIAPLVADANARETQRAQAMGGSATSQGQAGAQIPPGAKSREAQQAREEAQGREAAQARQAAQAKTTRRVPPRARPPGAGSHPGSEACACGTRRQTPRRAA